MPLGRLSNGRWLWAVIDKFGFYTKLMWFPSISSLNLHLMPVRIGKTISFSSAFWFRHVVVHIIHISLQSYTLS